MTILPWVSFLALVFFCLGLDLGVLSRGKKEPDAKSAAGWTVFWISIGLSFTGVIYYGYEHHWMGLGDTVGHAISGRQAALEYLTGYIVEKSLSLDNIFVFAAIFGYFQVARSLQHRVLYWGIFGALLLRGLMIGLGVALIQSFDWIIYVFGGILILTAVKMARSHEEAPEPGKNWLVRIVCRIWPVTNEFHGEHFMVKTENGRALTPLAIVLVVVESSDVLFAVDSIPAVFAVTTDPFLVFTSNVFAILGLRALYFFLAAMIARFAYLKHALVVLLAVVGIKMLISHHVKIPTLWSLVIITSILAGGVVYSLLAEKKHAPPPAA